MKTELSPELLYLLNGKNIEEKQKEAMLLMTVTEDGWPHNAMISVGEVVALNEKKLKLALWPGTKTNENIIRSEKAFLIVVYNGKVNYVRLSLERIGILEGAKYPLERFSATVVCFKEDIAKYAEINSGIQIMLKNPNDVLQRWKETLGELVI
jgi:hypothetical protein